MDLQQRLLFFSSPKKNLFPQSHVREGRGKLDGLLCERKSRCCDNEACERRFTPKLALVIKRVETRLTLS